MDAKCPEMPALSRTESRWHPVGPAQVQDCAAPLAALCPHLRVCQQHLLVQDHVIDGKDHRFCWGCNDLHPLDKFQSNQRCAIGVVFPTSVPQGPNTGYAWQKLPDNGATVPASDRGVIASLCTRCSAHETVQREPSSHPFGWPASHRYQLVVAFIFVVTENGCVPAGWAGIRTSHSAGASKACIAASRGVLWFDDKP